MAWKDKLQPASFRGVLFHVESDDTAAGRRVQVHEYPQRDKPYAEDLGRATREINLTAFVIGPEYMAARDRLLGAIEEAGPGTLVHPWYGALQVVITSCRVTHSNADGGLARFALSCVEAGELTFPQASSATDAQTRLAADNLAAAATDDFATAFSVDGVPGFVRDSALAEVTGALGAVRAGIKSLSSTVDGALGSMLGGLDDLLSDPRALATEVLGAYNGLVGLVEAPSRLVSRLSGSLGAFASRKSRNYQVSRALLDIVRNSSLSVPATVTGATPSRVTEVANTTAVRALVRRSLLTTAARAVSASSLPIYDEAVDVRKSLTSALDSEGHTAADPVFAALTDLRVKVHQDVAARTRDAARLNRVTPREVQPAVVLAYDLYEDAGRDVEIVERNRVRHPGFLPAEPLLVLSR
ncbi:DNA circularization protein [Thauera phenylacetica]|uniref:DNA circularization protein n=1 Tax=Thauera phenylacetica TaxID=164400 RepID=UPI0039E39BD0